MTDELTHFHVTGTFPDGKLYLTSIHAKTAAAAKREAVKRWAPKVTVTPVATRKASE